MVNESEIDDWLDSDDESKASTPAPPPKPKPPPRAAASPAPRSPAFPPSSSSANATRDDRASDAPPTEAMRNVLLSPEAKKKPPPPPKPRDDATSASDRGGARGGDRRPQRDDAFPSHHEVNTALDPRARLDAVLKRPENVTCAECPTRNPCWASLNLGVFFCLNCSGVHRGLGVHVSKVRSTSMDKWSEENVAFMEKIGNSRANAYWEANVPPGAKPMA